MTAATRQTPGTREKLDEQLSRPLAAQMTPFGTHRNGPVQAGITDHIGG
jgi:hypothetical protein